MITNMKISFTHKRFNEEHKFSFISEGSAASYLKEFNRFKILNNNVYQNNDHHVTKKWCINRGITIYTINFLRKY
jgi:hypothetical protein